MNIILYIPYPEKDNDLSEQVVGKLSKYPNVHLHRTLNGLYRKLSGGFDENRPPTVLLFIPNRGCLMDICAHKEYFLDKKLILVLPDAEAETVSLGFRLFPRFVTYTDSDGTDICSVIEKMVSKECSGIYEGQDSSLYAKAL